MRLLAALLLLVTLAACTDDDRAAPTPLPTSPISTPSTPDPEPSIADLPRGPAPRIGYVVGATYVAPDGARTPIPTSHHIGVLAVAPVDDGLLVQRADNFEGYTGLELVRGGRVVEEWSTAGPPVVGLDGAVAWGEATSSEASVQPPPAVRFAVDGVRRVQRLPLDRDPVVAGVMDGEVLVSQQFARGVPGQRTQATDLVASPRDLPYSWIGDLDERHGRAVAQRGGGRSAVVDLATGEQLWRVSRYEPERFSPSGRWVFAQPPGHQSAALLDAASGEVEATLDIPGGGYVVQAMWESDRALLVVVLQRRSVAVARVGPSGRLELALPVTRTDRHGLAPGYVLEQRA